jgi:NAD(P)H-dependent flavin oxidoreductase YrpB (nitropropane dioxygenase family)
VGRQAIIESGVRVVETEGRSPRGRVAHLKRHGIAVFHKRTSVCHALSVKRMRVVEISADGFDCTGNGGGATSRVPCSFPPPRASFTELSRLELHV